MLGARCSRLGSALYSSAIAASKSAAPLSPLRFAAAHASASASRRRHPHQQQQHQRAVSTTAMATAAAAAGGAPDPAGGKFKLALCQLSVSADKAANIAAMRAAVAEAAGAGAALVVLPEMWNCPYSNDSFPVYAEDFPPPPSDGSPSVAAAAPEAAPSFRALSEAAAAHRVTLIGGSIPERAAAGGTGSGSSALYNTCCVFGPDGKLLARHRKTHLFDIDIPGKITFRESDTLTAGEAGTVADTPLGRVGVGICYDIRFSELAALYARRGARLVVYPGAFNMTTGPVHWELLAKARAVDNQCYVAVCSPARDESGQGYQAWGHSTVVGPFAEVLATTGHGPGIIYADVDFAQVDERRANMPLAQQRRGDLYELVDVQQRQR